MSAENDKICCDSYVNFELSDNEAPREDDNSNNSNNSNNADNIVDLKKTEGSCIRLTDQSPEAKKCIVQANYNKLMDLINENKAKNRHTTTNENILDDEDNEDELLNKIDLNKLMGLITADDTEEEEEEDEDEDETEENDRKNTYKTDDEHLSDLFVKVDINYVLTMNGKPRYVVKTEKEAKEALWDIAKTCCRWIQPRSSYNVSFHQTSENSLVVKTIHTNFLFSYDSDFCTVEYHPVYVLEK